MKTPTRLKISLHDDNTASLAVWRGGPSDACRRAVGALQFWGNPNGLVTNLTARQRAADVAETYQFLALDRHRLRVVYHVARAGARVQCDWVVTARKTRPATGPGRPVRPARVPTEFLPGGSARTRAAFFQRESSVLNAALPMPLFRLNTAFFLFVQPFNFSKP